MGISAKLRTLSIGRKVRSGGLIGHRTSTLPGIAASPYSKKGVLKASFFKQRKGPFLLLADSTETALAQAVYLTPALRKLAKESWPGAVTLVFRARNKQLHPYCFQKGFIAVRVDQDSETRRLARTCGGLLLSSSLNRKGEETKQPDFKLRFRWQRHFSGMLYGGDSSGAASIIYRLSGSKVSRLR